MPSCSRNFDFRVTPWHRSFNCTKNWTNGALNARPTWRCERNERDAAGCEVLLVLQVGVGCNQRVEPFLFGGVQQLAIRQLRPAALVGRDDLMLRQRATQRFGRALVEQYAHLGRGKRAAGGVIQHGTNLLKTDARKPIHEFRDQRSVFKVLKEC